MPVPSTLPEDSPTAAPRSLSAWTAATFFGVGMMGKGGGTAASALTVIIWYFAARSGEPVWTFTATAAAALLATVLGVHTGGVVAKEANLKDPSQVVIDEVAGQLIALLAAPLNWKYLLASFILFRGFDIVKPPPVRQLERLPGGVGIMMDDVAAGFLALFLGQLLRLTGIFH